MKHEIIKGTEKDFEGCEDNFVTKYRIKGHDTENFSAHQSSKLFDCSLGHIVEVIAERRPIAEPVWDGEGLPPIGCVCEYRGNDTSWGEVRIIGYDEGKVVFKPSGEDYYGITPSHKAEFFPIRSPEDVARDEFIKELSGTVISGISIGTNFAAALYDAGYRKME